MENSPVISMSGGMVHASSPTPFTSSLPDPKTTLPQINAQRHLKAAGFVMVSGMYNLLGCSIRRWPYCCTYRLASQESAKALKNASLAYFLRKFWPVILSNRAAQAEIILLRAESHFAGA